MPRSSPGGGVNRRPRLPGQHLGALMPLGGTRESLLQEDIAHDRNVRKREVFCWPVALPTHFLAPPGRAQESCRTMLDGPREIGTFHAI